MRFKFFVLIFLFNIKECSSKFKYKIAEMVACKTVRSRDLQKLYKNTVYVTDQAFLRKGIFRFLQHLRVVFISPSLIPDFV